MARFRFFWEIIKMMVVSLAIIVPIRYFLIQPFIVNGASMEPNFHDNEYLIVDEISYRFGQPARGDIVIFRYPKNPQEFFIKRVIGLPGETIQITDGQVHIFNSQHPEGFVLQEPYLTDGLKTPSYTDDKIKLADDEYYMLGDNRLYSKDSRFFGAVNRSFITGRVFFRGWPLNKIEFYTPAEFSTNN